MVSLNWVTTASFAFLAFLCLCVFLGMRRMPSLGWLVATAMLATLQTVLVTMAANDMLASVIVSVLTPMAYLCFGQAIGETLGQKHQYRALYVLIGCSILLGVSLRIVDTPFMYRMPVFQISCALALLDSLIRLWRHKEKGILEYGLGFVVAGVASFFLYRLAVYPWLFAVGTSYAAILQSDVERVMLVLHAVFSSAALLLMLALIINGVIVSYRRRSELDGLTGLLNHQAFHQLASIADRTGGSVIFCDVDHFKSINDRFGHSAGDRALSAVADILRSSGHDTGRLGGEEFAILCPGFTTELALAEAERLRKSFGDLRHGDFPAELRITVSFGIASYEPGEAPIRAFSNADKALYAAKATGRNRVVLHEDLPAAKSAAA